MERLESSTILDHLLGPHGNMDMQVRVLRMSRRRRCSSVVKVLGMSVGNLKAAKEDDSATVKGRPCAIDQQPKDRIPKVDH